MSGALRFGAILAGGSGERFWPLSRKNRPKQLLHLTDPDRSMIEEAADRLAGVMPREHLYVITGAHLAEPIRAARIGLPPENVLSEPHKRNTSGALAWLTAYLLATHPEADAASMSIAVVTADHRIGDMTAFRAMVDAALSAAETHDALVVCGVPPAHPETGFGYIQARGAAQPAPNTIGGLGFYPVQGFHEKPNRERAENFVASGEYFWNSGMFFWRVSTFLRELDRARPELSHAIREMRAALVANNPVRASEVFASVEDLAIDVALMERAERVLMVKCAFPWSDVGLWPAIADLHEADAHDNCVVGDAVLADAHGCIVYNATPRGRVAVGVAGAENLVVVVTDDAVLVVPKDRAGDVRHLVAEFRSRNAPQV